jgi:integrase
VKKATVTNWNHARRCLLAYFGPDRPLASITAGDSKDWERWLKTGKARKIRYDERAVTDGLAPNTARKRVSNAKQFFEDAVSRELITKNPFKGLKGTVGGNRARDHFITREATEKIIEACPNNEWRLLFALSRYGGLRCPSEHLALTWADINLAGGRLTIHSPKTEHHEGKGTRDIPLFSELRPHLEALWDDAKPGIDCPLTAHVITRYRDPNQNLRTQLKRIIGRAGLKPWPKLFHNLRASRATELANEYPAHVAAAWLGHSTLVANKHYWQVTDSDFERAAKQVAQKVAQQPQESAGNEGKRRGVKTPLTLQNTKKPRFRGV